MSKSILTPFFSSVLVLILVGCPVPQKIEFLNQSKNSIKVFHKNGEEVMLPNSKLEIGLNKIIIVESSLGKMKYIMPNGGTVSPNLEEVEGIKIYEEVTSMGDDWQICISYKNDSKLHLAAINKKSGMVCPVWNQLDGYPLIGNRE